MSTYNEERFISESISSILQQTYPYFELVVVNDGSTDSTLEKIKAFQDNRIVLIDKPNSGLPDSLNKAISISRYDWIARMDGDDIAEPDRFEKQVKYLTERIDILGGQYKTIDENGDYITGKVSKKPLSSFKCKTWLLLGMSPLVHPSVIIRKSLLDKYGPYDINFRAAQDLELWSRLAPTARIKNCKEVVLKSRNHNNSITSSRASLQRELAFLGYLKYVLRIRQPLSPMQFSNFYQLFKGNGLIDKNNLLFEKSHKIKGRIRALYILFYYLWRLSLLLRLRIQCGKIKMDVLSSPEY